MKEEYRKKIKETIGEMKCPKDFKCVESGFENLCKAKDYGMEKFLECLDANPLDCMFAFPFGYSYLCACPIRVYIPRKLKFKVEVIETKKTQSHEAVPLQKGITEISNMKYLINSAIQD